MCDHGLSGKAAGRTSGPQPPPSWPGRLYAGPAGSRPESSLSLSGLQLVWQQENSLQEEHQQVPGGSQPLRHEDGAGGQTGGGFAPHSQLYRYPGAAVSSGHWHPPASPRLEPFEGHRFCPVLLLRVWVLLAVRTGRPLPRGSTCERQPACLSDGHAGRGHEAHPAPRSGSGPFVPLWCRCPGFLFEKLFIPVSQANGSWHGGTSPPAGASPHSDLSDNSD